jgi:hypothetical protein
VLSEANDKQFAEAAEQTVVFDDPGVGTWNG